MPSPVTRRVVAIASAVALGVAGTLATAPAFATEATDEASTIAVVPAPKVVSPVSEVEAAPLAEASKSGPVGPITPADTTAPVVTSTSYAYQAKEGGRIAVTVTFNEDLHPGKGFEQGWYGSGNVFTKVYYRTKDVTATFADKSGNKVVVPLSIDATAPTVTGIAQSYQTKEGGRIAVTLTFSEDINPASLGQGWYGSGNVFTKVYYRTKDVTVTFADFTGNPGTTTFTVDATAPTAVATTVWQPKEGGRTSVTLTFSEPINSASLGQGWLGSGTVYSKVYYGTKSVTVGFADLIGNPGSVSFTTSASAPAL